MSTTRPSWKLKTFAERQKVAKLKRALFAIKKDTQEASIRKVAQEALSATCQVAIR